MDSGNDPERGVAGLLLSGENLDRAAADPLGLGDEFWSVGSIAACRGRDRIDTADLLHLAQGAKAPQRGQRFLHRIGGKQSGGLHLAAEAATTILDAGRDEAA